MACEHCGKKIAKKDLPDHNHCGLCDTVCSAAEVEPHKAVCPHRVVTCECGETHLAKEAKEHKYPNSHAPRGCDQCAHLSLRCTPDRSNCPILPVQCPYCHLPHPRKDSEAHQTVCGSRTGQCDVCQRHIKLSELETHVATCADIPPPGGWPSTRTSSHRGARAALSSSEAGLSAAIAGSLGPSGRTGVRSCISRGAAAVSHTITMAVPPPAGHWRRCHEATW